MKKQIQINEIHYQLLQLIGKCKKKNNIPYSG